MSETVVTRPGDADALLLEADQFFNARQSEQARQAYERYLAHFPATVSVLNRLASLLVDAKDHTKAIELLDQSVAMDANQPNAIALRGISLGRLKKYDQALKSLEEAIALKPDFAEVYNHLAIFLIEVNRFDEAIQRYLQTIELNPKHANAMGNLAYLLADLRRYEESLRYYNQSILLAPDVPETYFLKAELLLSMGRYLEGWMLYEWRWKSKFRQSTTFLPDVPVWTGVEKLRGKSIVIWPEAGFGDYLMLSRYLPLLEQKGAKLVLWTAQPLVACLQDSFPKAVVVPKNEAPPATDFQCPIMSLPGAFQTEIGTIPSHFPYLKTSPLKVEEWGKRLGPRRALRVGLVWSGKVGREIDRSPLRTRSMPLADLEPLFRLPIEFHSLQKEILEVDVVAANRFKTLRFHHDEIQDFSDTAALIQHMDLVVSIDTSVSHLVGALGKPLIMMLPFTSDYRWAEGDRTPWYPQAQLIRQRVAGDWRSVVKRVAERLSAKLFESPRPCLLWKVAPVAHRKMEIASPRDFTPLGFLPIPDRRWPRFSPIPYGFDFLQQRIMYTADLDPQEAARAVFHYEHLRENVRTMISVPWETRLKQPRFRHPDPIFIFSPGRAGSTLLADLIRSTGALSLSEPDIFAQMAIAFPKIPRDTSLPQSVVRVFRRAVSDLIAPLIQGQDSAQVVIKLRMESNLRPELPLTVCQQTPKTLFIVRRFRSWAQSILAVKPISIEAAGRLYHDALLAYRHLKAASHCLLVRYEDLRPDCAAALQSIADHIERPLESIDLSVLGRHSQDGTAIKKSREAGLTKVPDAATIDAWWRDHAPADLLLELGLAELTDPTWPSDTAVNQVSVKKPSTKKPSTKKPSTKKPAAQEPETKRAARKKS
jgi:tetratricopeptide (TPR) repeat protein